MKKSNSFEELPNLRLLVEEATYVGFDDGDGDVDEYLINRIHKDSPFIKYIFKLNLINPKLYKADIYGIYMVEHGSYMDLCDKIVKHFNENVLEENTGCPDKLNTNKNESIDGIQ